MTIPTEEIQDYEIAIQNNLIALSNYNRWVVSTFDGQYGKRILDIGSSIGNITQIILDKYNPELLVSIDKNEKAVREITTRFQNRRNFKAQRMRIDSKASINLRRHKFDTITCFNVLEHIEDDHKALENMRKILMPKGRLILLVPAIQSIYGNFDKSAGHFRRYEKNELENKVKSAGFKVESIRFFDIAGIITWFLYGRIIKPGTYPKRSELTAIDYLVPLCSKIEDSIKPPIGLSLACSCTK